MHHRTIPLGRFGRAALGSLTLGVIASGHMVGAATPLMAQDQPPRRSADVDTNLFRALRFRNVGPSRGGRATAGVGVPGQPFTFYFGGTGGGVWKTTNAGHTWDNVTDGFLAVGSIGAIAVADADPNVVYVGTGSAEPRGNVSVGRGVYRSADAGKTWAFVGLPEAGQIGQIRIHPKDPNLVYVAATGHIFGPNAERGVFRSRDGGGHWEKVLYVSDSTGAIDLTVDPRDARVLYAALWRAERKPWLIISGAREGGVYKSTDGGDHWTPVTNGLPGPLVGRIGLALSPAKPDRVWALVEASEDQEGLYRSDDGGRSFRPINLGQKMLMARPWYYTRIFADPVDANVVYVMNESFWKSTDGGATFTRVRVAHGDNHNLWIAPEDPRRMIVTNDGGAAVTLDGGATWSTQNNQPTGEFYFVETDDQFPYRLYGPQQDNTTISVPSRTVHGLTPSSDWYEVGGCETGPVALDPARPNVVYAGCYGGRVTRWDARTNQARQIADYPHIHHGQSSRELKYRFQWNAPIVLSRHDRALYHGSQFVHRSTDDGQSWQIISPDLTSNDTTKQTHGGGPITWDMTGAEVYPSLFALAEAPKEAGVLWAGSNDGLVHVTRDGGKTWKRVTPPDLPPNTTINRIDVSPHAPGRAFVAAYRYQLDDFRPYAYRTDDYGAHWTRIADGTNGIPIDHPVRVVREDPERRGLLYAGTEFGLFVSFDDGARWQPLQRNLPRTPVMDLQVHAGDLVVATQGRAFWILDDVSALRQLTPVIAAAPTHLFAPRPAFRTPAERGPEGANPPNGAIIEFVVARPATELAAEPSAEPVTLAILDARGQTIDTFGSAASDSSHRLTVRPGLNRFVWNLAYPGADLEPDMRPTPNRDIIWGYTGGPIAVPGAYRVRLTVGAWSAERPLTVRLDPRVTGVSAADLAAQFAYVSAVRDALSDAQRTVRRLRAARAANAAESATRRWSAATAQEIDALERELVEPRAGDVAKLRPALSDQLAWLNSQQEGVDAAPTTQALARLRELTGQLRALQRRLTAVTGTGGVPVGRD